MCAWLPPGMAEAAAAADPTSNYPRTRDGNYLCVHLNTVYEDKLKNGPALIVRHRILESSPIKTGVDPSPPGEILSLFMPDYGKAKVMLVKNFKAYVLALLALENKKGDAVFQRKLQETMDLIGGPQQIGRGMLIRASTFHTTTDEDTDFMGYNWTAVPGENDPRLPSVVARRQALDSEKSTEIPGAAPAPGVPAVPGVPTVPGVPGVPVDPLAGWKIHEQNPLYVYEINPDGSPKGTPARLKAEVLAGR